MKNIYLDTSKKCIICGIPNIIINKYVFVRFYKKSDIYFAGACDSCYKRHDSWLTVYKIIKMEESERFIKKIRYNNGRIRIKELVERIIKEANSINIDIEKVIEGIRIKAKEEDIREILE